MNQTAKRKKIAVIFGGCSPEYKVSLQSASAVIAHIDPNRYALVLIGISADGTWHYYEGGIEKISADTWRNDADCSPVSLNLCRNRHAIFIYKNNQVIEETIDAAFPILHGKNGEDGSVQGLLELAGIPIIGCGVLSSALCMDKDRAHQLVSAAGIAVPKSFALTDSADMDYAYSKAEQLGYPLFVKPIKAGSSFGVSKVRTPEELKGAIELAFEFDCQILLEQFIDGFEVGCAIIGTDELTTGEVDEIELASGFFDFTEKYTLKTSAIHVPARISPAISNLIKQTAKIIYRTLDCQGFARIDLFLSSSGRLVFNEVNTIPGFTAHSRFPNMLKAVGMSFEQIVTAVIETAVI